MLLHCNLCHLVGPIFPSQLQLIFVLLDEIKSTAIGRSTNLRYLPCCSSAAFIVIMSGFVFVA